MATIIMGSYMVRYPLGGNLSWALQYLTGFKDLGHDIYMLEKHVYDEACFDPIQQKLTNDCTNGVNCSDAKHEENRRTEFTILSCSTCP